LNNLACAAVLNRGRGAESRDKKSS